jgi:hypothetical protein
METVVGEKAIGPGQTWGVRMTSKGDGFSRTWQLPYFIPRPSSTVPLKVVAIWLPWLGPEAQDLLGLTDAESMKSSVFSRTGTWVELYESAALTN